MFANHMTRCSPPEQVFSYCTFLTVVWKSGKDSLWKEGFLVVHGLGGVMPSVGSSVAEVMGVGHAARTPLLGRYESFATTHASSSPFHLRPWGGGTHIHSELSLT